MPPVGFACNNRLWVAETAWTGGLMQWALAQGKGR